MFPKPGNVTNLMVNLNCCQHIQLQTQIRPYFLVLQCFSHWVGDLLVVLVVQDVVVLIDDDVGHTGEGRESSGLAGFYLRAFQLPRIGLIF